MDAAPRSSWPHSRHTDSGSQIHECAVAFCQGFGVFPLRLEHSPLLRDDIRDAKLSQFVRGTHDPNVVVRAPKDTLLKERQGGLRGFGPSECTRDLCAYGLFCQLPAETGLTNGDS